MTVLKLRDNPLEERYSQAIMLSLYRNGTQRKTDLLQNISKSSCMLGRLDRLEASKLVIITNDKFSNNTKWVSLTQKGEKIAKLLDEIDKTLFES